MFTAIKNRFRSFVLSTVEATFKVKFTDLAESIEECEGKCAELEDTDNELASKLDELESQIEDLSEKGYTDEDDVTQVMEDNFERMLEDCNISSEVEDLSSKVDDVDTDLRNVDRKFAALRDLLIERGLIDEVSLNTLLN